MARLLLVLLSLAGLAGTASAGWKCKKLPRIVFWNEAADVHDDGAWHRTKNKVEQAGRLTPDALTRFRALVSSAATPERVLGCLDALIADASGAAAKRACAVTADRR